MSRLWGPDMSDSASRVYCNGRCVGGPVISGASGSAFLLVLGLGVYSGGMVPFLVEQNVYISLVPCVTLLWSLAALFVTATTDPGIIPRQSEDDQVRMDAFGTEDNERVLTHVDARTGKEFEIAHQWCRTCKIYRPSHASHCRSCSNCVEHWDHHCPWVSNCVGRNNYRYFLWFVTSVVANCLMVLCFAVATLILLSRLDDSKPFIELLFERVVPGACSVALIVYACCTVWAMAGLCGYHWMLASNAQTTHDRIRGKFRDGNPNPRDMGKLSNFIAACCRPRSASFFGAIRRAHVQRV